MPEGVVDVIPVDLVSAAIIAVAAKGPDPEPEVVQVASGSQNPLRYRRLVDLVSDWFPEHPLYDTQGPAHRGAEVVVPRPGPGAGPAAAGPEDPRTGREHPRSAAAAGTPGRVDRQPREPSGTKRNRRSATSSCTAPTPSARRSTGVDRLLALWDAQDDDDRRDFCCDPRVIDWTDYVTETSTCPRSCKHARVRTTPGGRTGPSRETRLRAPGAGPRTPTRRVRPREHPHRVQRRRQLRLAGHPPPAAPTNASASSPSLLAEARRCSPRPPRPQRLPALLLPPLRRRSGRADRRGLRRDVQRPHPRQVVPGRHAPGARAPRRRPPHRAHHRRPRLRGRTARPTVRRHRRRRDGRHRTDATPAS